MGIKAFCEDCGWESEDCPDLEEAQLAAQEHQDEEHEVEDLTFYPVEEWVQ
jgi:hypothetical protein